MLSTLLDRFPLSLPKVLLEEISTTETESSVDRSPYPMVVFHKSQSLDAIVLECYQEIHSHRDAVLIDHWVISHRNSTRRIAHYSHRDRMNFPMKSLLTWQYVLGRLCRDDQASLWHAH